MHYRLNTIVFLEFGHCKSSSCQEQKMVGMLGLHEALPKWQFESIIVFFKVAYTTNENQQILLHPLPSQIKECQK